ncbi:MULTISPECIES: DedA family protein [Mucilaginibacter]|jgi:membrane-associated protein|uniref:DedA family protein n=1 Tax=Mucilaginibacter ginsenosidivorax TaxID=862126 RepID=A0A5B8VZV4_9SPHI|nr:MULTISPECIES: VTT domain-containing protein [Mucilaginibacter]QEC76195.1 DedA family protein [Mucilaginibacter ginsenosidivorax]SEP30837.1 membrane-associated protein [Mucilaginibacter sp. OK283]
MESFWDYLQNLTDAQSIISRGGFYFLLVVVFAETGLFFGFFLPGDYLLFMAGLLCSAGKVDVNISTLVLSLIAAGILGNFTGYWFGHRTGPVLFNRNDSLFFKKRYVILASDFYNKYGGMALILGRFFPIVRTFAPIFAGVVKVDLKKFALYNLVGCVAWVCTFTLGGFFLGKRFPQLKDYMQYVVLGLIVITTIPLVVAYVRKKIAENKEQNIR